MENPSPTTAREILASRVSGHFYLPFISIRKLSQPKDVRAVSVLFLDPQFNSEIVQVLLLFEKKLKIPFLRQETPDLKALQMQAFVEKDKQVDWITHRLATFW